MQPFCFRRSSAFELWRPPPCKAPVAQQRGPCPGLWSFPWPGPRVYAFLRVPLLSGASALLLCESEVSRPRPPFLRPSPSGPQRSAAECSVRGAGPFRLCAPPTLCASQRILPLEPFRRPVPLSRIALRAPSPEALCETRRRPTRAHHSRRPAPVSSAKTAVPPLRSGGFVILPLRRRPAQRFSAQRPILQTANTCAPTPHAPGRRHLPLRGRG